MTSHVDVLDPEDVRPALMTNSLSVDRVGDLYNGLDQRFGVPLDAFNAYVANSIFFSEGPTHKTLKRAASLASRTSLLNTRVDYRRIATEIAATLPLGQPVNLADAYSAAFVNRVVVEAYGLNPDEIEDYDRWRNNLEYLLSELPPWRQVKQFNTSARELHASLEHWFSCEDGRRLRASSLAEPCADLSLSETAYVGAALLLGGIATSYTLSNALLLILSDRRSHAAWKSAFAEDSALAARKMVGVCSAVSSVTRLCVEDITIGAHDLAKGDRVRVHLTSQAAPGPEPGPACPHTAPATHVGFGIGRHKCVGEMLAYEIIAAGLPVFFDRFDQSELIESGVKRDHSHPLARLLTLPVILGQTGSN
jgi:cytochrome P450